MKQVAKEGIQQTEDFFPEGQVEGIHEEDVGLAMDVRNAFFILSEEEQMIVGLSVFSGYNSTEIGKIPKPEARNCPGKTKPGAGEDAVCVGWEDIL